MKTLVIQRKYGGLGDHLFYSHIPRIAKETRAYERVLISNCSEFRNPETKKLVWEMNPFVDGFTDEPGLEPELNLDEAGAEKNFLDLIMLSYGLDDGRRWHDPEVFYVPKIIKELYGKTLYDPNFISIAGNDFNSRRVRRYFRQSGYRPDLEMISRDKSVSAFAGTPTIKANSLEHFCDILFSSERVVCLSSGTSHLAAALRKSARVLHAGTIHPAFFHSKIHDYILLPPDYKTVAFTERCWRGGKRRIKKLLGPS
jgi:hypothetical protein